MKDNLEFITFEIDELKALLVLAMSAGATRRNIEFTMDKTKSMDLSVFEKMFNRDAHQMILNKKRKDYAGLD